MHIVQNTIACAVFEEKAGRHLTVAFSSTIDALPNIRWVNKTPFSVGSIIQIGAELAHDRIKIYGTCIADLHMVEQEGGVARTC